MPNQTLIKEYSGIISDVQSEIKKLENDTKVLKKLYVILDVLHDVSYLTSWKNMLLVKEQCIIG